MLASVPVNVRFFQACLVTAVCACEGKPPLDSTTWVAPFGPDARTGFPDCDAVIEAYGPCIDAKAPASARADIRMGYERTIAYWLKIAEQPSTKRPGRGDTLTTICKELRAEWDKTAAAFGCDPPGPAAR